MPQPNFQYGKSIFGHMGRSKKAAQKNPIMNYEQLLSTVFSCFHGQKFKLFEKILHCSVRTKKLLNRIFFKKFKNLKKNYRLPAELNPAGKSNKTLWRHLFFLICGFIHQHRSSLRGREKKIVPHVLTAKDKLRFLNKYS